MNGVAWCMEFVQWCYARAGIPLPFKTPSCGGLLHWYCRNQPECIVREPVPGCIVIFDWPRTGSDTDHTGLFASKTATHITSIDGNTSDKSASDGGCVRRRIRRLEDVEPFYIVPRELRSSEENRMKRYQTLDEIKKEAPWAMETVETLTRAGALGGNGEGLDLSLDMLRVFTVNDRMGLYRGKKEEKK